MQKQKGISTLTGIIIIVIIVVVAIGGVFAYQYFTKSKTPTTETAGYFEIKELGLKFKITEDLKDLVYLIKDYSKETNNRSILFSTKSLVATGGTYCSISEAPLGAITWQTTLGSPGEIKVSYLIESDNLYVSYMGPQAPCSDVKAIQDLQTKQIESFRAALKTIVATKTQTDQTAGWKTYTNTQYGFEIKYPSDFTTSVSNCSQYKDSGEKISVSDAVKIENKASGMYVLICNFLTNYNQISKQDSANPVVINNHNAYSDKFIIRGGGRAYYYIDNGNSSLFIDTFWAYPNNSTNDNDLKQGEAIINSIISTFKFTNVVNENTGLPVIDSISPQSGPVGTVIEVRGKNLLGFEGDRNLWVKNSQGIQGIVYGDLVSTTSYIKATLSSPLCQTDESYRGLPCASWLELTPGVYKIYANPWGNKTNEVLFTITK